MYIFKNLFKKKSRERKSRIQMIFEENVSLFKDNPGKFIFLIVNSYLLSTCGISMFIQWFNVKVMKSQNSIYILSLFTKWACNPFWIVITAIIFLIFFDNFYRFFKINISEVYIDEFGRYISKKGELGKSHLATEDELKEIYTFKDYVEDVDDVVLGLKEIEGEYRIVLPNKNFKLPNKNSVIFGPTGCGKTEARIKNDIKAALMLGHSFVCTDTKGDVYRFYSAICEQLGYEVALIDLKAKELAHSDGVEFMKYVTKDNPASALVLAHSIIDNTGGNFEFWGNNAYLLLQALIALVATSDKFENNRTFKAVSDMINNPGTIDANFANLPADSPAKSPYDIYNWAKPEVKQSIVNGLGSRMNTLLIPEIAEIMAHDEVDLILPYKKRCAYFVVIDDQTSTFNLVAAMFFAQIFSAQITWYDGLTSTQQDHVIPIHYILDEAFSVGVIPDWAQIMSTFRSRHIDATMIFQNVKQPIMMYGEEGWSSVVGNCATQICYRHDDPYTIKYFTELCSDCTQIVFDEAHQEHRTNYGDAHNEERVAGKKTATTVIPRGFLKSLEFDDSFLMYRKGSITILDKFMFYRDDPWAEKMELRRTVDHIPKWRIEKEKSLKESIANIESIKASQSGNPSPEGHDKSGTETSVPNSPESAPILPAPQTATASTPPTPPPAVPERRIYNEEDSPEFIPTESFDFSGMPTASGDIDVVDKETGEVISTIPNSQTKKSIDEKPKQNTPKKNENKNETKGSKLFGPGFKTL